jgi:hypothetical protein
MSVVSIWADKHRILRSINGERPEVIAMCKNHSVAVMLAGAWVSHMQQQQPGREASFVIPGKYETTVGST